MTRAALLCCIALLSATLGARSAAAELVCLPLDGTFDDVSGNGNHAVANGGTFAGGCASGSCIELDGSNDHLTIASSQLDDLATFTYSAWIAPDAHGDRQVVSKRSSNREFRLKNDNLRGCVVASPNACSTSEETIPLGLWTMVTMTYTHPGAVRLYVNGTEVDYDKQSSSASDLSSDNTTAFFIGRRSSGDRHFDGRIDELRVYDRAISSAEVQDLYDTGGACRVLPIVTAVAPTS
ncbi:MAG: LamG domain-containing protein [Deltaproteobacteria bacterium]|nr:LamG domain-containing protein [Deltaproteobacteria bacterium]